MDEFTDVGDFRFLKLLVLDVILDQNENPARSAIRFQS